MEFLVALKLFIDIIRSGEVLTRWPEMLKAGLVILQAAAEQLLLPGAEPEGRTLHGIGETFSEETVLANCESYLAAQETAGTEEYTAIPIDWKALILLVLQYLTTIIKG